MRLTQGVLEAPGGLFELPFQGVHLFGDVAQFFSGNRTGANNLMRFAIGFAERAADFYGDFLKLIFGHGTPPHRGPMIKESGGFAADELEPVATCKPGIAGYKQSIEWPC